MGDRGLNNVVDTAFLWQPAIPDTALSNDPRQDTSVLRNWHFPQAHRAARTLVVLHSAQDNVLGGHTDAQARQQDCKPQDASTEWAECIGGILLNGVYTAAARLGIPASHLFAPWALPKLYARWARNLTADNYPEFKKQLQAEVLKDHTGQAYENLSLRRAQ